MAGAQQLLQNNPPLSLGPRRRLVIPPAQALGPLFQPGRNVPVLTLDPFAEYLKFPFFALSVINPCPADD